MCGGRAGIRTLETRERLLLFESSAFSHSATLPFTLSYLLKDHLMGFVVRASLQYTSAAYLKSVSPIVFGLNYNIYAELVKIP